MLRFEFGDLAYGASGPEARWGAPTSRATLRPVAQTSLRTPISSLPSSIPGRTYCLECKNFPGDPSWGRPALMRWRTAQSLHSPMELRRTGRGFTGWCWRSDMGLVFQQTLSLQFGDGFATVIETSSPCRQSYCVVSKALASLRAGMKSPGFVLCSWNRFLPKLRG